LIDHVEVIRGASYITQTCCKVLKAESSRNLVIYFPDSGSLKRYSEFVSDDYPIVYGIKNRDWKTGEILGIEIHGDTDKLDENTAILMIDDICSKGGTFYYGSKELNKYGCKDMYLYVTHCENTILDGELLKADSLFKKVFTTRSIFTKEHEKVEVLDL
jgi:ribose-phosphate pyrophosphokinase